jgi:5-methylcytosine-specific restriction endonuclease McrA
MLCELCLREVDEHTLHHLIPKSRGGDGKGVIASCKACHRMIHSLFSNQLLTTELNTIDKLIKHPDMQRFIRWVRKQDPNKQIKVHQKIQ